jgi:hypothetical protein
MKQKTGRRSDQRTAPTKAVCLNATRRTDVFPSRLLTTRLPSLRPSIPIKSLYHIFQIVSRISPESGRIKRPNPSQLWKKPNQ